MALTRRALLTALPALAATGARATSSSPAPKLYVVPLAPAPVARDLAAIERALLAFLAVDVVVTATAPMPSAAWYAPRKRWRGDVLLEHLEETRADDAWRVLGVTRADISVTKGAHKDWGVMGYGSIGGPSCVVSRFRCRIGARDVAHTRERLMKVCVHEVGHTLGSGHCAVQGCLMEDARGSVRTVDRERAFCAATRALFVRENMPLRAFPAPLGW